MKSGQKEFLLTDITHYAHHKSVKGYFSEPENAEQTIEAVYAAIQRGLNICVLGAQNSFSDIFLGEGKLHISLAKQNKVISFNQQTGEITVQPGIRIWQVLQILMPRGFYLTGLSGSYTDTIGGMISSNSHGKDSWKYANCGNNVTRLKLLTADGSILTVEKKTPLMNAVVGGLGMLGVITEITLQPKKLPSYFVTCSDKIIPSTDITAFEKDAHYKYIWLDMANPKKPLSVVKLATFNLSLKDRPFKVPAAKPTVWNLPSPVFWKSLRLLWNQHTYIPSNSFLRGVHYLRTGTYTNTVVDYYYPWRKYPDNCMLFSNNAFHEMQVLFPTATFQQALAELSKLTQRYGIYPLNVNVKWHCADSFYLSFSGEGLCLLTTFESSLFTSVNGRKLAEAYMEVVESMGGKMYLSKFSYLTHQQLRKQYPLFENWLSVKKQTDPNNIFLSDRAKTLLGL